MKLTNRTNMKKFLLNYAKANRHHPFTRVSTATLDQLEARLQALLREHVHSAPSKGSTL